jgi:hypothetical protein
VVIRNIGLGPAIAISVTATSEWATIDMESIAALSVDSQSNVKLRMTPPEDFKPSDK